MKQKLMLVPLVFLLMLVSTVTPVMAIGPQKAEKNPHIGITVEGAELVLPSGVVNEWVANREIGVMDFEHILDASKAKILNAMPLTVAELIGTMTDPETALQYENKWGYMSNAVIEGFFEWLISIGYPITPEEVALIVSMYPEGMYIMFVNVGQ